MSPHPLADAIRVANLALAAWSIGLSALSLVIYLRAYHSWMGLRWAWIGMLPRHVVLITISYLVFLVMGTVDSIEHLHQPLRVATGAYFVGFALGALALWDVLGVERERTVDIRRGAD